jgi:hypothetical protein
MRFLEQFVEAPLAGTLGWALLHSVWEGAIISAALAAVLLVFRSPRVRYAAACSATLAMAGGFALTLTLLNILRSPRPSRSTGRPVPLVPATSAVIVMREAPRPIQA